MASAITYVSTSRRRRLRESERRPAVQEPRAVIADFLVTGSFGLAIEVAPTGMVLVNEDGLIVLLNEPVERLFSYSRDELVGRPVEMLVPDRFRRGHPGQRRDFFGEAAARPKAGQDFLGLRKDGTEVPVEIGLSPLRTPEGRFVLCSLVDLTERIRGEREREDLLRQLRDATAELDERVQARTEELQAALRDREVLLQEVHHRVKNNLQLMSSLIHMQVRSLGAGASRDALLDCETRVRAIALVHEKLHQSRENAQLPFSEYARTLATDIFQVTGASSAKVSLEFAIERVDVAMDDTIPCGLILNELVTNAIKHAFPDGRVGTLRIEVAPIGRTGLRLAVADDGVGLPHGFDVRSCTSLGLQLVQMLARQIDATLDIESRAGTRIIITLPGEA
jgi:PAS domain S-box-containing protein